MKHEQNIVTHEQPASYYITDTHVLFWGGMLGSYSNGTFKWAMPGADDNVEHDFCCVKQAFQWAKNQYTDLLDMKDVQCVYDVIKSIVYAKCSQNKYFRDYLMNPIFGDREFAYASQFETLWGIGVAMNGKHILNNSKWRGKNLYGKAITEVRRELLKGDENQN